MTDLEIIVLCMKAMGFCWTGPNYTPPNYDPLHDDAQAMALVKKLRLGIVCFHDLMWSVNDRKNVAQSADLNHAICECVAKTQAAKRSAGP